MDKEQPISEDSGNVSYENLDNGALEVTLGSLDKFKDVQSLQSAYINLQSEFTRKCQRLSELEKDNCELKEKFNPQPFYERPEWDDYVKEFLRSNQDATSVAGEILDILVKDKDMACRPNSLQLAYDKIKASKFRSDSEIASDETFLNNYIYNNDSIKQHIIDEYLAKFKNNQSPQLINNTMSSSLGLAPFNRPTTLSEAKVLAEKLFRK